MHDFRLFTASQVVFAHSQICLADRGYQGIVKLHTRKLHAEQETS